MVSLSVGEKLVDLHLKLTLVWQVNRLLFEVLHLVLSPDLFFIVWVKGGLLVGISQALEFYSAFYIISSLSGKQRNVMTIAFVPMSGLSFGPLRLFPIVRSCSLRLFYVMGDKGVGKQIYCLFFLKAFLFILDSANGTFTAEAIGFLLSVLFLGVINKISYPFLNLLLLFTFKGHVFAWLQC